MRFFRMRGLPLLRPCLGSLCFAAVLSAGPGFGGLGGLRKQTMELKTRQPAPVRLANTSIAVIGKETAPQYAPVVQSLEVALGTELVGNEKSLVEQPPDKAQWVLALIVTGFSISQPQQYTQGTGTSAVTYNRWNGSLNAAYQVIDHSGRVYDAANVASNYNKDFPVSAIGKQSRWTIPGFPKKGPAAGEKVPSSVEDVKQDLIQDVVLQIASKLGNTTKDVEVEIATGDSHLNRAAEFFQQQLWSRALEELEKTPAFEKPNEEAYRQYDLGLAYEAISYTSTNPDDQKQNIYKAAEYYDKALEMNEKEKYFVATVARTRDALARYKQLEVMNKQDQKVAPPGSSSAHATEDAQANSKKPLVGADGATPVPAPASGNKLTVDRVIQMYKKGVSMQQILEIVKGSQLQFDPLDPDTAIAIHDANLPISLQNAMRARVGAPPLKPPSVQKTAAAKTS